VDKVVDKFVDEPLATPERPVVSSAKPRRGSLGRVPEEVVQG